MKILIRNETYYLAGVLIAVVMFWKRDKIQEVAHNVGAYIASRGLRNNNPGNIRKSGDAWQGLSDEQNDAAFFTFNTAEYGIRALVKIIKRYISAYNLNTVRGIITRWAPPSENNTAAYIRAVCNETDLGPDEAINFDRDILALTKAIIKHENGTQPYTDAQLNAGIRLAV